METKTESLPPIRLLAQPLISRKISIGKTCLEEAKRNLALDQSFGHSFTHGPIYQISRLMVEIPGAMSSEVAFNNHNILDVIVTKVNEEKYVQIVDKIVSEHPKDITVNGDEIILKLSDLVISCEPKGFGKFPCITIMSHAFFEARLTAREQSLSEEYVA